MCISCSVGNSNFNRKRFQAARCANEHHASASYSRRKIFRPSLCEPPGHASTHSRTIYGAGNGYSGKARSDLCGVVSSDYANSHRQRSEGALRFWIYWVTPAGIKITLNLYGYMRSHSVTSPRLFPSLRLRFWLAFDLPLVPVNIKQLFHLSARDSLL